MNSSIKHSFHSCRPQLVIVGTGGTIAGHSHTAGDHVGYTAGQIRAKDLLAPLAPVLATRLEGFEVLAEQLAQLDSKDMDERTWTQLAQRVNEWLADDSVAGIVITHGTDTIEETAYWVHRVVAPTKPVVLTCAMRPANALGADGPQNLFDALTVASTAAAAGVWVVVAGAIHHPVWVSKVHPYRLDAFQSMNVGAAGWIEEGRVRWGMSMPESTSSLTARAPMRVPDGPWPRVEVLFSHGGASEAMLRSVLTNAGEDAPLRGLVVVGTGNGTIHHAWTDLLQQAQANGVQIWRTSRCADGVVVVATDGKEEIPSVGLSPFKARIEMVLHLTQKDTESRSA